MSKKGSEHSTVKQFALSGHSRAVKMVRYNHDGDMFFTCSDDKLIIAWSNETAEKMGVYQGPSACKSLAVSRYTEYVIGAYSMEGIVIFDALTGKEVFKFKPEFGDKTEYIEFNYGDSELLVLITKSGKSQVQLYDFGKLLNKDKKVRKVFNFDEEITQASYGYLNEKLYVSTSKGKMMILDIDTEKVEVEEKVHPGHQIFSFTFSKDYSMLASCGKDGKCKLLHPETLEVLKIYDKESP
jgi:translation initiation factor 3 subunit I